MVLLNHTVVEDEDLLLKHLTRLVVALDQVVPVVEEMETVVLTLVVPLVVLIKVLVVEVVLYMNKHGQVDQEKL